MTCALKLTREEKELSYKLYRIKYLPRQLEATRAKLRALENEARRYGMEDIL